MTRRQIQYFLAVARLHSFTKAAGELYIAQPSITKQVKALEAELGVSLFERDSRSVKLTEAGQLYQACFARFEEDLTRTQKAAEAILLREGHTLRFVAMNELAIRNYNLFVQDFCARHKEGTYDLSRSDAPNIYQLLKERRVDMAMIYDDWLPNFSQDFECFPIEQSTYIAVLNRAHPLAGETRITRENMRNYALILTEAERNYLQTVCPANFISALGIDLSKTRITQNYLSHFSTLEVSDGIILLDEHSQIPSGERYVKIPTEIHHWGCAVWNPGPRKPLFDVFLKELRQRNPHS